MKRLATLIALILAAIAGVVSVSAQQLSIKRALNLAVAKTIAAAAEKEAMANKWAMFITIIDDGGTVLYVERIDDAQIGSYEVSMQKAQSALKFRRPTKAFEDL